MDAEESEQDSEERVALGSSGTHEGNLPVEKEHDIIWSRVLMKLT